MLNPIQRYRNLPYHGCLQFSAKCSTFFVDKDVSVRFFLATGWIRTRLDTIGNKAQSKSQDLKTVLDRSTHKLMYGLAYATQPARPGQCSLRGPACAMQPVQPVQPRPAQCRLRGQNRSVQKASPLRRSGVRLADQFIDVRRHNILRQDSFQLRANQCLLGVYQS